MKAQPVVILAALAAAAAITISANIDLQAQGTMQDAQADEPFVLKPGLILKPEQVSIIERPGHYGLGANLPGSSYAISDGHLVRIDADSLRVQSILRRDIRMADQAN